MLSSAVMESSAATAAFRRRSVHAKTNGVVAIDHRDNLCGRAL